MNSHPVGSHGTRTDLLLMTIIWMDSNTVLESDLSLKSRSFLHRVNDRVRKMLDQSSKDATQDRNKHCLKWWMLCLRHYNHLYSWERITQKIFHSIKNTGKDITMKQDVQDIWTVDIGTIGWDFWSVSNQLGKFSMETVTSGYWWRSVISLLFAKVYVFSDSVLCFGKMNQNPTWTTFWEPQLEWFKDSSQYGTLELVRDVQKFMNKMAEPNNSKGEISSCWCFNNISWGSEDADLVSMYARRVSPGRCSFLGLGSEKKWYSTHDSRTQGEWNRVAELMMIEFRESGHPVFRSTSPLSRGNAKKQRRWTNIYTSVPIGHTIETVVRTIISVYQLSIYGAVSDLCEEYSIRQTSTGRPVLAEQSHPFFAPADLLIMASTSVNSTLHTSFSHAVNTQ